MIIKVDGLSKNYDYYQKEQGIKGSLKNLFSRKKMSKEAVKNISFNIEEGELVGFLGPNGAGKTTTLKMLSGILYPSSGIATVLGFTPWERKKNFKMDFAIVMGQKSQLWWDLPASESLLLNKAIYEVEDNDYKKTVNELAEILEVNDLLNIQVRKLSLGERMKMELIASLLHKPKLLFLDEPTIGLDLISQRRIREFFKHYNRDKKITILLTSHYMSDIEELCDKRTIIINQGEIVFDDSLNKIHDHLSLKKNMQMTFSKPVEKDILEKFGIVRNYNSLEAKLEVDGMDIKEVSKRILEQLPVIDLKIQDMPLEDGIALYYNKR